MALYSTAQVVVVILAPSLVFIIVVFLFYWLWFQCVYRGQPPVQPVQPATDTQTLNGLWHVGRVVKHPGGEHVVALGNSLTVVKPYETLVDHPV